jgi:hypothetical protein
MPKTSAKKNDLGRMKFMCLMTGMAAPNVRPNVQGVVRHGPAEPAATPIAASPQVARKKQRVVDAVPHTRVGIDSPAFVRPLPDISELGTPVCLPRLPQATPPVRVPLQPVRAQPAVATPTPAPVEEPTPRPHAPPPHASPPTKPQQNPPPQQAGQPGATPAGSAASDTGSVEIHPWVRELMQQHGFETANTADVKLPTRLAASKQMEQRTFVRAKVQPYTGAEPLPSSVPVQATISGDHVAAAFAFAAEYDLLTQGETAKRNAAGISYCPHT